MPNLVLTYSLVASNNGSKFSVQSNNPDSSSLSVKVESNTSNRRSSHGVPNPDSRREDKVEDNSESPTPSRKSLSIDVSLREKGLVSNIMIEESKLKSPISCMKNREGSGHSSPCPSIENKTENLMEINAPISAQTIKIETESNKSTTNSIQSTKVQKVRQKVLNQQMLRAQLKLSNH